MPIEQDEFGFGRIVLNDREGFDSRLEGAIGSSTIH
jgi:hypothetical protein